MKEISRRRFVANSCGLLLPFQPFLSLPKSDLSGQKNILVLIHLAGGNDWFNTIIPHRCPDYYQSRPTLAIPVHASLPLNDVIAFHPALSGIKTLYDQNKVALVLNVGHNQSTLSHHKAIEIWQNAYPDESSPQHLFEHLKEKSPLTTWFGRYAKYATTQLSDNLVFPAINIEPFVAAKNRITVSNLSAANNFAFDVDIHYRLDVRRGPYDRPVSSAAYTDELHPSLPEIDYAKDSLNNFTHGLNIIANLIEQNHNATIYNISLGGFDTHTNQSEQHALLLHMLSQAIFSFQQHLNKQGSSNRVLTVIHSEFGRSLIENEDLGTEHGLRNHMLVIGNSTKGGIYGSYDNLTLEPSDAHQFDFRDVYATLLNKWLMSSHDSIFGPYLAEMNFI